MHGILNKSYQLRPKYEAERKRDCLALPTAIQLQFRRSSQLLLSALLSGHATRLCPRFRVHVHGINRNVRLLFACWAALLCGRPGRCLLFLLLGWGVVELHAEQVQGSATGRTHHWGQDWNPPPKVSSTGKTAWNGIEKAGTESWLSDFQKALYIKQPVKTDRDVAGILQIPSPRLKPWPMGQSVLFFPESC